MVAATNHRRKCGARYRYRRSVRAPGCANDVAAAGAWCSSARAVTRLSGVAELRLDPRPSSSAKAGDSGELRASVPFVMRLSKSQPCGIARVLCRGAGCACLSLSRTHVRGCPRTGVRGSRSPQKERGGWSAVWRLTLAPCGAAPFREGCSPHGAPPRRLCDTGRAFGKVSKTHAVSQLLAGGPSASGRSPVPPERRLAKPARGRRPCPTSGSPLEAPLDEQG